MYLYIDTVFKIYDYIKDQFESVIFYCIQYEMNLNYMDWYERGKMFRVSIERDLKRELVACEGQNKINML